LYLLSTIFYFTYVFIDKPVHLCICSFIHLLLLSF
jgi:hypothetical protein